MSFYELVKNYNNSEFFNQNISNLGVEKILKKDYLSDIDFWKLLQPEAEIHLEEMAQKAYKITRAYFGKAIQIFSPLYISNYCENGCLYCGYRCNSGIKRKKLSENEIISNSKEIYKTGVRNILILTGEAPIKTPLSYTIDAIKSVKDLFPMIGIEIHALTESEYKDVHDAGVNYVTLYQETYQEDFYQKYHIKGPKKDYSFRLDAPERAAKAKMVGLNIGILAGLAPLERDIFFLGLHGYYLQKKYPDIEISFSIPRLRPTEGGFVYHQNVDDKKYLQMLLALKIWLPRAGVTLSTRESDMFRNNILPLGITKISAGVKTSVGGYSDENSSIFDEKNKTNLKISTENTEQFEISDTRSVKEISDYLKSHGFQPIFKDWEPL
ncbi:2-iminoacetate synthase ThiH [bacterium]|nr:2-iminoacetate synthase ThiH [bacterium]